MLALTPGPLQTAGERAVFAELARWDTGGAVRSAVVASLPMVDGPMGRRISDAVLFVPEGIAVVRIAEVPKQRGVVTAVPEGAWSIAPDARPGEVLQIAGGGSSPLDGLMRAGMETALRLRQAGLEPGRIARLTVLVGELTGLVPADGDLGEGDQVALLESRSLLLGIARSARYAGVDNPRLWTTADVRSALEVLGLPGRGPSVEELNGEGFPYSPYVLRRRELLTPAAMNAASAAPPPRPAAAPAAPDPAPVPAAAAAPAPFRAPVTGGFVAPSPEGPRVDPAAAAAVAAAAIRADEAAAAHQAAMADEAQRAAETQRAAEAQRAAMAAEAQRAAVAAPHQVPVHAATAPAPFVAAAPVHGAPAAWTAPEETDGIGGLFARSETDTGAPALPPTLVSPVVSAPEHGRPLLERPQSEWRPADRPEGMPLVVARRRPDRTRRLALLGGGAVLLVVLVVLGLVLVLGGGDDRDPGGNRSADPAPTTAAPAGTDRPAVGQQTPLDDLTFTLQVVEEDGSCSGHAYGEVSAFLAGRDCTGLARALYSTEVGGAPVVVSVSAVDMGDAESAAALQQLADSDGSGNVSDLLREGETYPGGPSRLRDAEYASTVEGSVVTIVESSWAGSGQGSVADLNRVAGVALALPMPDPTP